MTSCFAESYERRYRGLLTGLLPECGPVLRSGDGLLGQAFHVGQGTGVERLVDVAIAVDGQRPGHHLTDPRAAAAPGQYHVVRRPVDCTADAVTGATGEANDVGPQRLRGADVLPVGHRLAVEADVEVLRRGRQGDRRGRGRREDVLVTLRIPGSVGWRDLDDDPRIEPAARP